MKINYKLDSNSDFIKFYFDKVNPNKYSDAISSAFNTIVDLRKSNKYLFGLRLGFFDVVDVNKFLLAYVSKFKSKELRNYSLFYSHFSINDDLHGIFMADDDYYENIRFGDNIFTGRFLLFYDKDLKFFNLKLINKMFDLFNNMEASLFVFFGNGEKFISFGRNSLSSDIGESNAGKYLISFKNIDLKDLFNNAKKIVDICNFDWLLNKIFIDVKKFDDLNLTGSFIVGKNGDLFNIIRGFIKNDNLFCEVSLKNNLEVKCNVNYDFYKSNKNLFEGIESDNFGILISKEKMRNILFSDEKIENGNDNVSKFGMFDIFTPVSSVVGADFDKFLNECQSYHVSSSYVYENENEYMHNIKNFIDFLTDNYYHNYDRFLRDFDSFMINDSEIIMITNKAKSYNEGLEAFYSQDLLKHLVDKFYSKKKMIFLINHYYSSGLDLFKVLPLTLYGNKYLGVVSAYGNLSYGISIDPSIFYSNKLNKVFSHSKEVLDFLYKNNLLNKFTFKICD